MANYVGFNERHGRYTVSLRLYREDVLLQEKMFSYSILYAAIFKKNFVEIRMTEYVTTWKTDRLTDIERPQ